MAPSGGSWMSAIPLLSGDKQTFGEQAEKAAHDPTQTSRVDPRSVSGSRQDAT